MKIFPLVLTLYYYYLYPALVFLDDREKDEDLSNWKSTKRTASWKSLSFNEVKELQKQIEPLGIPAIITDRLLIKGNYFYERFKYKIRLNQEILLETRFSSMSERCECDNCSTILKIYFLS